MISDVDSKYVINLTKPLTGSNVISLHLSVTALSISARTTATLL